MAIKIGIPPSDTLVDRQFIEIPGADGTTTSYQYDKETNTLIRKESQIIIPSFHGHTHIVEDPIPESTPFVRGLQSAEDKAKLDALTQTRLGVLGFQGAGFPDDGGFMYGDVLLAAGSEFISIERVGNVIRFTVDSPIPLACNCFVDGCNVSMADGTIKAIEDINVGDKVLTHTGKTQIVTKTMKEPYNDKVLDIKICGHNDKFVVTPGHPVYSLSERVNSRRTSSIRNNTGLLIKDIDISWVLSHDLDDNDFVVSRYGSNEVIDVNEIIMSDHYSGNYIIKGDKIYPARVSSKDNKFVDGMSKGIPNVLPLDEDLMRLFGYYLAEGCCSKKNGIRFTVNRFEMKAGEIGSDIINIVRNKFGIEPKVQNKPSCANAVDIQFFSNVLVDIFKNWFNTKACNKYIPQWMLNLNSDLQYQLLVGFIKGDGSKFSNGNIRIEVSSQSLTNQIRFIADRCDLHFTSYNRRKINGNKSSNIIYDNICFTATHNKKLTNDICNVEVNEAKLFNYLKNDDNKLHKIDKVIERHHAGFVYNLEVENDHSYVVNGIVVHNCEECAQIYWIQDESEPRSVRPPSCNGIMPDASLYGEMKIYVYPENSIFNPNKAEEFFNKKNIVPSLVFKRYENGNNINEAEYHFALNKNSNGTTKTGWSFTPGSNGVPECVWFMGVDKEGRQISFEFEKEDEPGLLGSLLYNGHSITRQNAVITGYTENILETNIYKVKKWSIMDSEVIDDEFNAQNLWKFHNPEGGDATPTRLELDRTVQLLDVGEIIELYNFKIGQYQDGSPILKSYFSKKPSVNPANIWSFSDGIKFGDLQEERYVSNISDDIFAVLSDNPDSKNFEKSQWGLTNFDNDLYIPNDGMVDSQGFYEPWAVLINNKLQSKIDYSIPGLIVHETIRDTRGDINGDGIIDEQDLIELMKNIGRTVTDDTCFNPNADLNGDGIIDVRDLNILGTNLNESKLPFNPVWLWHRKNHDNFLLKAKIGLPLEDAVNYPPIDIIVGGPIDSNADKYLKVNERGIYETGPFANLPYIKVSGLKWDELPSNGSLKVLNGIFKENIWKYQHKIFDGYNVILVGFEDIFPFDEDFIESYIPGTGDTGNTCSTTITAMTSVTDLTDETVPELPSIPINTIVVELIKSDYTVPAVRLSFEVNRTTGAESVQLRVLAGTLSMSAPYIDESIDDNIRGFLPGEFTTSGTLTQMGFIDDGIGADIQSQPDDFKIYNGGFLPAPVGNSIEKWNELEIMKRNEQIWVWWNGYLITPSSVLSSQLPVPVPVNTPYFPVKSEKLSKVGLRMWPGTVIRDILIRDESLGFNEYIRGQLKIDC